LKRRHREAIFSVYGFVRFADEIVDTFHDADQQYLLMKFEEDLKDSLDRGISMNPVLHSFQKTVHEFAIPYELIDAFLRSMKTDLEKKVYSSDEETADYIYGSANVVGLMCLKIFTGNDDEQYNNLKKPAMMLGSAFQKVNFLRDLASDIHNLSRIYFYGYNFDHFDEESRDRLVNEIQLEFNEAAKGIALLPGRSRLAVLTAYYYYLHLLKKIASTNPAMIMNARTRITNTMKFALLVKSMLMYKLKLI
jgi:phytoene/squalene synthetase